MQVKGTLASEGARHTIAWQFTKAGNLHFGRLIPGQFEVGMVGNVVVK